MSMTAGNISDVFITIAIPFFNAEKFLPNAIKSVFAQTFKNWELILIDDGSTDSSLSIARSIKDPRVRVFSDGKNKRLSARLNEVTSMAKYGFIARMDADDMMSPMRLESQINLLLKNPEIDLVSSGLYSVNDDCGLVGYRGRNERDFTVPEIVSGKKGILHAGVLARKSWYERNRYNESIPLSEDLDMWARAIKKNDLKILTTADLLYIYRESQSVTAAKMMKAYKVERNFLCAHIDDLPSRFKSIAKSYFKTAIIFFLSKSGGVAFLQSRRSNSKFDNEFSEKYSSILKRITSTSVPGLELGEA